jgi:transposase
MARRHGRCQRGQRLRSSVPHGHWKTTTFIAGLRRSGMVAPMVLDGPINRDAFVADVRQVLVPDLSPGDIVIMDNLSSHKVPAAREAIKAAGATLLVLPPDSPDFNPIEPAFSKLKAHLRKAAEKTIHGLWNAIGRILDLYPPQECANYFTNSGYNADSWETALRIRLSLPTGDRRGAKDRSAILASGRLRVMGRLNEKLRAADERVTEAEVEAIGKGRLRADTRTCLGGPKATPASFRRA